MPREVKVWQRTEPSDGHVVCWHCEGWGGHDATVCYGFGGEEDWQKCITCGGSGQIDESYAKFLKEWQR